MSLRQFTNKAQNNACDVNVANDFVAYSNSSIKMLLVPMTKIVNMDETNSHFSAESTRTCADAGSRSVGVSG